MLFFLSGCSNESATDQKVERPLRQMNQAIAKGDWQEAWSFVDAAVAEHPKSPLVLTNAAQVAHENQQPERSAELLVQACRAQGFSNAARVHQAVVAMVGVGRFYESMELLEDVVAKRPEQHESRRLLYDFYAGTDNRLLTLQHGRQLIRQRRFDLGLLMTISNTQQRTMDSDPLNEMTNRNPDDKRPLLGSARHAFDDGKYDDAIKLLEEIVQAHADFLPAQALYGRTLAAAERFELLESWAESQSESIQKYPDYWLAIGDWARFKNQTAAMARAYWESTQRDADMMESWQKLSAALRQNQDSTVSQEMLAAIDQRVKLLSRFNQQKKRFERSGSISRDVANEIAKTLSELGRLWEAEAWASMAMTLPEDDSVAVNETREKIVAQLRQDTPWQFVSQRPEFAVDLSNLSLPMLVNASSLGEASPEMVANKSRDDGKSVSLGDQFELVDQAKQRGISFHGRTSDELDQPGIMLFQTLGCGGATIDFDLDGWDDLYLVAAGGKPPATDSAANVLMRNLLGQFSDVGKQANGNDKGFGQGVAVGDVNADGFPDVLVLNYGLNALLINNGDGTFARQANSPDEDPSGWSTSAAIADISNDSLADIVVTQYCAGLDAVNKACGEEVTRSCTPMMFPALADVFWEGSTAGKFNDRTQQWGAIPDVLGRGLGVVIGSFDDLPGLDVIVANDMTNNHYWNVPGQPTPLALVESAMIRGLGGDDRASAQGSMGIATGDFDSDGDVDFYITNFENEYNILHEQQSAGSWRDMTGARQLVDSTMPLVGFGTEAADLDNDGDLELVISNGHVDMFSRGDEKSIYKHPMQVFSVNDQKTYRPAVLTGDYGTQPHVGRALWTIDANRDGRTDFAVTHQTEPVALLVNQSENQNQWIGLTLVGQKCGRDAVGATIQLTAGQRTFASQVTAGGGYLSSNEKTVRFGIGSHDGICRADVTWPDGSQQTFDDMQPGRNWLLVQDDTVAFELR